MYAIIEVGGKQEKVAVGDVLCVEHISNKNEVTFNHVLLVNDDKDIKIGSPFVKGAKVNALVLDQVRGEKVISSFYRRRKSSRRKHGHRQSLTKVEVTEIVS